MAPLPIDRLYDDEGAWPRFAPSAGEPWTEREALRVRQLWMVLEAASPPGWRTRPRLGIRCGRGGFTPDLTTLPPGVPRAAGAWLDVVPTLVVEVESANSRTVDRGGKPEAYAAHGIPRYWRVEEDGAVVVHRLCGGRYEPERFPPFEAVRLTVPYPLVIPSR
ncbi:MAG TPA: Uma2 family endonuclease [Phytomonospora sp.]